MIKTLTSIRQEIRMGKPFNVTACTFDEKRGNGGARETYEGVILVQGSNDNAQSISPAVAGQGGGVRTERNPHHLLWGTFNIRLQTMEVRKLHYLLLEMYNGYQVVI